MFTPQQRRQWGGGSSSGKGKGVLVTTETPQKTAWQPSDWSKDGDTEEVAWRRFKDAGLLDEVELQRKEKESLNQRIAELETELCSYQHAMGLLLIEKNELSVKIDDLSQRLDEANEIWKREQSARLITVSESEKREESLKKALSCEKQCVADLENALRGIQTQINETKSSSEMKLEEAQSLESKLEDKKIEAERKMCLADARLAEASMKNSQASSKLEDLETLQSKLNKEKLFFETQRGIFEKNSTEKEGNLHDWEIKLQESQKKLYERQDSLNEREDRINEKERVFLHKRQELEELKKESVLISNSMKAKEEDFNQRLQALSDKEKDLELRVSSQEVKERGFIPREAHLSQREENLEKKMHKLKQLESDLDSKSRALKNWEASVKEEEKKLKTERGQFEIDSKELKSLKLELDILKNNLEKESLRISREEESLKLTRKEKEEYLMLKSQLEREIEKEREINENLLREMKDLRKQKENFEKEWDLLDEKRRDFDIEKESFLSLRNQDENMKCGIEDERNARYNAKLEEIRIKEEISNMEIQKKNLELNEFYENRKNELLELEKEIQARKQSEEKSLETKAEKLTREKELLENEKEKLETDRNEFSNDVNTLTSLRTQITNQREELIKQKDRAFSLIEKFKSCKECGASVINDAEINIKDPRSIEIPKNPFDGSLKGSPLSDAGSSGTRMTWLKKCSQILSKKTEIPSMEKNNNDNTKKNDDEMIPSPMVEGENNDNENIPIVESSAKKRRGRAKGKTIIKRTHSVAEVLKESKVILEDDKEEEKSNWRSPVPGRKRRLRESVLPEEDEEEESESMSLNLSQSQSQSVSATVGGGRRKRRQTVGPTLMLTPGEKRYNFRRSTIANAEKSKGATEATKPSESEIKSTAGDGDEISKPDDNEVQQVVNKNKVIQPVVLGMAAPTSTTKRRKKKEVVMSPEKKDAAVISAQIVEQEIVEEGIVGEEIAVGGVKESEIAVSQYASGEEVEEEEEEEEEGEEEDDADKTIGKKIWNFLIN